jgi:hypothetical protein
MFFPYLFGTNLPFTILPPAALAKSSADREVAGAFEAIGIFG